MTLRARVDAWQQHRAMRRIRDGFAAVGFPLDGLTDGQIEAGVLQVGKVLTRIGVTVAEFDQSMEVLRRALNLSPAELARLDAHVQGLASG